LRQDGSGKKRQTLRKNCATVGATTRGGVANAATSTYLQPQSLPQLHSFLSFIGQFLPVFFQLALSAAKVVVQSSATRIDIRIFIEVFI